MNALVKFGSREHILQLQEEGLLYMNNLPYFWKIEDDGLRGDVFDSINGVDRGIKGKITFQGGTELSDAVTNWTLRMPPKEPKKINIFCMYAFRPSEGAFPVDDKNFKFGDFSLVVTNPQEFISRIGTHLKNHRIKGKANFVEYVDNKYTGPVGPFKKLKKFDYQFEWRLVCCDGPGMACKISIGNIHDISIVIPSNKINEKIMSV